MEQTAQINIYHAKLFAYFLEKMRSTTDGDGSLLDHSMIVYGSGMGDGDLHTQQKMPILIMGGGAGQIQGGRHIRYPERTPLTNLYMAILGKLGVPIESFGDSTGRIEQLSEV